jgi:hypothetical protein
MGAGAGGGADVGAGGGAGAWFASRAARSLTNAQAASTAVAASPAPKRSHRWWPSSSTIACTPQTIVLVKATNESVTSAAVAALRGGPGPLLRAPILTWASHQGSATAT